MLNNNKELFVPCTFTSSETLLPVQEDIIEKAFNSTVYDWYGNSERTISLYKKDGNYYEPPLYSINNYHNNLVLTTSLINHDFPLINYEVDDLIVPEKTYSKTQQSVVINKIEGRKDDFITLFNGSKVGTAALSLIFRDVDIQNSQIIQKDSNSLVFKVVPGSKFNTQKDVF